MLMSQNCEQMHILVKKEYFLNSFTKRKCNKLEILNDAFKTNHKSSLAILIKHHPCWLSRQITLFWWHIIKTQHNNVEHIAKKLDVQDQWM